LGILKIDTQSIL